MKNNSVIYQISMRAFTAEGTIASARGMLGYLKRIGFDFVYLCPVFCEDDEEDRTSWSPRQRASGCDNPKNPYKIKDYFNVDPEYGTNRDLKEFIDAAHRNNIGVMLDLVYLHCGKNAVFIKDNPDWVIRDEVGNTAVGETWPFARLNYENRNLREYLISNMEYYARDYRADGFRCDVGDAVPLDFWAEAVARVKRINPDIIMFNEGWKEEYVQSVFDFCYASYAPDRIFDSDSPSAELIKQLEENRKYNCRLANMAENHDIASDSWPNRKEIVYGGRKMDAWYFMLYALEGRVMIFNGNEIADRAEQNMFSNRFFGRRIGIDWSNSLRPDGRRRYRLIRQLNGLRREYPMLITAQTRVVSGDWERVLVFTRIQDGTKLTFAVNLTSKPVVISSTGLPEFEKLLIKHNAAAVDGGIRLGAYGCTVME